MSRVEIRAAAPVDAPVVREMIRALAEYEGYEAPPGLTEDAMRAMLAPPEPRLHVLLAETEGRVVGFVSYMVRFSAWAVSEFISIDDLFVLEHARGLGAGRALMHQVGRVALARGLSVRWEVEAANEQALAFYRGLGASMAEKVMCRWEPRQIREALSRAGGAAALPPA